MELEYIHTSTVAHGDGSGKAPKKKVKSSRPGKGGSTQKMARDIAAVKADKPIREQPGRQAKKHRPSSSQAKKGMIKSIRQKQAKKANYQHEG